MSRRARVFTAAVACGLALTAAACDGGEDQPPATASATAVDVVAGATVGSGAEPVGPASWIERLHGPQSGEALQIACLDSNRDGVVDVEDDAGYQGLDIPIAKGTCSGPARQPDYYAGLPPPGAQCGGSAPLVLFVIIGGGGTQLLDTSSGVSFGLLEMRNALYDLAERSGMASRTLLTTSAITGADYPQTRMEQWLRLNVAQHLDEVPCARAVLFGHSHGGVTVTSVMTALETEFPGRLYGVLLDRSAALYDRPASELPVSATVLNVFQLNEGWHGDVIDQLNVTNVDQSTQVAPKEPRVGPEPLVTVTHTNLDDSIAVQTDIVERVMEWLTAPR